MNRIAPTIAVLLLGAVAYGCANGPERTPGEAALFESSRAIERSLDEADESANDMDSYELRIRYNEPHCGAPVFEILVFGRWTRVFLEGREAMLSQLEDTLVGEDASVGMRSALAYGSLVGQRETKKGLEFPVFEVERFEPDATSDPN
jgi:hypothetical protein